MSRGVWTKDIPNLLSKENLEKVRQALRLGIVCGLHAFYAGGGGPQACAFSDFDQYLDEVEKSAPGDWFTLWSVTDLAARGLLLIESHGTPPSTEVLAELEKFLRADAKHEYMVVARIAEDKSMEAEYGDIDSYDDLVALARRCGSFSDLYVLPLSSLEDNGRDGRPYSKHAVVDAKRANEQGEVPSGGPY
jgi:hypothetical protein